MSTNCSPCSDGTNPSSSSTIVTAGKYGAVMDENNNHFALKPKPCSLMHHRANGSRPAGWSDGSQDDRICLSNLYGRPNDAAGWLVGLDASKRLMKFGPSTTGGKHIPVAQSGAILWEPLGESNTFFEEGVIGPPEGTCSLSLAAFAGCPGGTALQLVRLPTSTCGFIRGDGVISSPVPAGMILAFGGQTSLVPEGFIPCDGRLLDPTVYPELYAAIGFSWGKQGALFAAPDLRGLVPRGVDAEGVRDPDNGSRTAIQSGGSVAENVGSLQTDALQGHRHTVKTVDVPVGTSSTTVGLGGSKVITYVKSVTSTLKDAEGDVIDHPDYTSARVASETRMANAYVQYVVAAGC